MNTINEANGVLVIYTGGTIGSIPKNKKEPNSPLIPLSKDNVDKKGENPLFDLIQSYDSKYQQIILEGQPIRLDLKSLAEPIDSSNVSPNVWGEIIDIIKTEYYNYEGFVILHGTDTMTYTASILSFMIDRLNKPIIITGSQIPIGNTRSDAVQNLVTAIEIAAAKSLNKFVVPEVCIFFRNKLLRGCRTIKYSASNYEAFQSPNMIELGTADEHIVINEKIVRKGSSQNPDYFKEYSPKVMFVKIAPGVDIEIIETLLTAENLEGIILLTYGTGNAPTLTNFLNVIDKSIKQGKIIINVTQCMSGEVELGLYDVSAGLLSRGVISGLDMTEEAAYTKLCHLLGVYKNKKDPVSKENLTKEQIIRSVSDEMQINMRGEQRQSIYNIHFGGGEISEEEESVTFYKQGEMVGKDSYDHNLVDKAFLRIMGLTEPDGGKTQSARGKVYINLDDANSKSPETGDNFLGSFDKRWNPEAGKENIFLTITDQIKKNIGRDSKINITIVNENGRKLKWERMQIGIFANI